MRALSLAKLKLAVVALVSLGWGTGLTAATPLVVRDWTRSQLIGQPPADRSVPVGWQPHRLLEAADGPLGATSQVNVAYAGHRAAILEPRPRLEPAQRRRSPRESWRGGRRKVKWQTSKGVHETPAQAPLRLLAD